MTWGWLWQACRAITRIMDPNYLDGIDKPVLIVTAGRDHLVDNQASLVMLASLKNAEYVCFPQAKHEIFLETDEISAADKPFYKE